MTDLKAIYESLMERSRNDGFAGWDPFDGLESRIFQALPLRHFTPSRIAWLQMVKRSPWNLRPLLLVPNGLNAKGLALFALAELSRYRATNDVHHRDQASEILRILRPLAIETKNGVAFGYNFDWQSRVFFAPKGTPTIVPTAFAARAIYEDWQHSGDQAFERLLARIGRFISDELNRSIETSDELCFSYTPRDHTKIYNASLLAAEALAYASQVGDEHDFSRLSQKTVNFVLNGQREDGSWLYGPGEVHGWVDNFHTAFVLDSLRRISSIMPMTKPQIDPAIGRGFDHWLDNFFLEDGTPKYFDRQTYPIDIHAAAAAIVTLSGFAGQDERALTLAEKIAKWSVREMWSDDGYFYYQKRRLMKVRTPFVRWGQAWMAYALASLLEARSKRERE